MKNVSVVIGSLFGDEGKGHMVDICANKPSTVNIRFNGGAQAGHTVVTPDGKQHVFRHFGSGTFLGAITYLSEEFIVNTFAFEQERLELEEKFNITPIVHANPNCIVTTLWDIYINQIVETLRGDNRHGSCGMGIDETVRRSDNIEYKITVMDLLSPSKLITKLEKIQNEYIPIRLKNRHHISIDDIPPKFVAKLLDKENIDMFMFYAKEFISNVQIMDTSVIQRWDNVVFEGAQGLLLDQNCDEFRPHLTTSNTGIKNVMKILSEIGYTEKPDLYYMTRCYMTRHGAGPFPELGKKPYLKIEDPTNLPNEFQGTLRFGILDVDWLTRAINKDLTNLTLPANIYVTFTCVDQLDDIAKYHINNTLEALEKTQFINVMSKILNTRINGLNGIYATAGLTRNDFISV